MPSNLMAIDSNFPSFTGEETPEQQIRELVNYLYQLRESLQYSLQNLGRENFNVTALDQMNEDAQKQLVEQLQKLANELSTVKGNVDTLIGRMSALDELSGRVTDAEKDVEALQIWSADQELAVQDLTTRMGNAETELGTLKTGQDAQDGRIEVLEGQMEAVETLEEAVAEISGKVQVQEDGSATVGEEGKDLHLIGNIYINGILFEQGGTNETT